MKKHFKNIIFNLAVAGILAVPIVAIADTLWTSANGVIYTTNSDYVGIGTPTPERQFHIFSETAAYAPMLKLQNANAGLGYGAGIEFQLSTDFTDYKKAEIRAIAESAYGNAIGLSFWSGGSHSYDHAERMRIDSTGKVGIGTATPTQALDVNGSTVNYETPNSPLNELEYKKRREALFV